MTIKKHFVLGMHQWPIYQQMQYKSYSEQVNSRKRNFDSYQWDIYWELEAVIGTVCAELVKKTNDPDDLCWIKAEKWYIERVEILSKIQWPESIKAAGFRPLDYMSWAYENEGAEITQLVESWHDEERRQSMEDWLLTQ